MGDDKLENIAEQIANSEGPSGHNVEYLLRLAMFMREELTGIHDEHLFKLEMLVKDNLVRRKINISSLMGIQPDTIRRDSHETLRRQITFEYTSRIQDKKLRCLNI